MTKERELIKMAKFGAAYGMGSETFAKAVTETTRLSDHSLQAMSYALAAAMEQARFKILGGSIFTQTNYKEETIVQHRFGERKPHNGKRLYRLWIDGVWVGDFKSKAERRKVLESTRVLMEEPEAPRIAIVPPMPGLYDDLPPDSYF